MYIEYTLIGNLARLESGLSELVFNYREVNLFFMYLYILYKS